MVALSSHNERLFDATNVGGQHLERAGCAPTGRQLLTRQARWLDPRADPQLQGQQLSQRVINLT